MMTEIPSSWPPPPDELHLPEDEVHVWRASLEQPAGRIVELYRLLSPEEKKRAGRFLSSAPRRCFIVSQGILRKLLGRYTGLPPEDLEFAYGSHGKPGLTGPLERLRFNLSHSRSIALYAVAVEREVGVDVERIRSGVKIERIARRFFSASEFGRLSNLPAGLRREGFFNCWTRKEAYLKARGTGLSGGLSNFAVSLDPREPAALLECEGDPAAVERWEMRALSPGPGYAGAICVEGRGWILRCWQWSG